MFETKTVQYFIHLSDYRSGTCMFSEVKPFSEHTPVFHTHTQIHVQYLCVWDHTYCRMTFEKYPDANLLSPLALRVYTTIYLSDKVVGPETARCLKRQISCHNKRYIQLSQSRPCTGGKRCSLLWQKRQISSKILMDWLIKVDKKHRRVI